MNTYKEFEPTPFYFLNDTFNAEEISRQLDIMAKKGISAFFLHLRDGILDEAFGTASFFARVRYIVEQAIARGIKVWLYDEDSYPSGNGGGKIVVDHPELQARALKVEKIKVEKPSLVHKVLGRVCGLRAYCVQEKGGKEKVTCLDDCFGVVRRRWYKRSADKAYYWDMDDLHYEHVRAATCYTEITFESEIPEACDLYIAYLQPVTTDLRYGTQVDCLNLQATETYLATVYEKYKSAIGEFFGKQIPGVFLDEPYVGGILAYTDGLPAYFEKEFGYKAEDNYYKLCADYQGDSASFRRDYVSTIAKMFRENFLQPIKDWCKRHDLTFTGHFCNEENILGQALSGQSVYRNVQIMDVPGFDIITTNIGDIKHPALILGANLAVSGALHSGKEKVLAECFALMPYNAGYADLKRVADWLFVCGINWLIPHAFHYGYSCFQRADAGKSFFFQDPKFAEYVEFSRYAGRVCKRLSEYKRRNNVLLVLPDGGFAEEVPFPMGNNGMQPSARATRIRERLSDFVRYAASRQVGFDCADTQAVIEGSYQNGKLMIGAGSYDKVVVIEGGEQERKAYEALRDNGVSCEMFVGTEIDGLPKPDDFSADSENVLAYKKYGEYGELLFLFANTENACRITLHTEKFAYIYDAESDKTYRFKQDGISLSGYESRIVLLFEKEIGCDGEYVETGATKEYKRIEKGEWTYMPIGARTAVKEYTLTLEKDKERQVVEKCPPCRLRDVLGTQDDIYKDKYVVPYFDTAKRSEPIYPYKARFQAEVTCVEKTDYCLFDKGTLEGDCEIYWNGRRIRKTDFYPKRVYDVSNTAFTPQWREGKNVLEICFEKGYEFDGVNGEIYVMKEDLK